MIDEKFEREKLRKFVGGLNRQPFTFKDVADAVFNEEYRKQEIIRKETAKEIFQELVNIMNTKCDDINADELHCIAQKYGIKVDELQGD